MARAAQVLLVLLIGVAAQCSAGHHSYHGKPHGHYSSGHHHKHGDDKQSNIDVMDPANDNNIDRAASPAADKPEPGVNSIHIGGKVVPLDGNDAGFDHKEVPSIVHVDGDSPSSVEEASPADDKDKPKINGVLPIKDSKPDQVADIEQPQLKPDLTGDVLDESGVSSEETPIFPGNDIIMTSPDYDEDEGLDKWLTRLPVGTDKKDEEGKKNGSMLIPILLPGGGHAYVFPSALDSSQRPSYSVVMINGQPTLVNNNQGMGGISGVSGIQGGMTLPSWLNVAGLGNGGSAGISVLPNIQQPIYIGSQYPSMGAGNGGYIIQNRPTVPITVPVPVPSPEPVPVPAPVSPGFIAPYPRENQVNMPKVNITQGSNFDWSSLINLLLEIDSLPSKTYPQINQQIPQPPPVPPQPTGQPNYPQPPNQQYPYPYPYPYPPYYPYPYPYPYPPTSGSGKNVPPINVDLTHKKDTKNPANRPSNVGGDVIPLPQPTPAPTEHVVAPVTEPQHITESTTKPVPVTEPQTPRPTQKPRPRPVEPNQPLKKESDYSSGEHHHRPEEDHSSSEEHHNHPNRHDSNSEEQKQRPDKAHRLPEDHDYSSEEHHNRPHSHEYSSEEHDRRPKEPKYSSEENFERPEQKVPKPKLLQPVIPKPAVPRPEIPKPKLPLTVVPQPLLPKPKVPLPVLPKPVVPLPVVPRPVVPEPKVPAVSQPHISKEKGQNPDGPQINIVLPKPTHIGKPKPGKSGLNSGLIDILNVLLKFPNKDSNKFKNSNKQSKDINHLIKLLLKILNSGDKNQQLLPNLDLGVKSEPNIDIGDLNIGSLSGLSNLGNNGNLGHLLLHILNEQSEPNLNVLVEPGMDESTRANLVLLLNLLMNNMGNSYQNTGYYQSGNPLLYFLGHFPCDHPNISAISGIQSNSNSNLWQLLSNLYGRNYELPQTALESTEAEEATPIEDVVENQKK